jgi:hypothetical protein
MRQDTPDGEPGDAVDAALESERTDWTTPLAIALAIVICIVAFIWFFLRLDPYLDDFISDDAPQTPTSDGTPTADSGHGRGLPHHALLYSVHLRDADNIPSSSTNI